MVSKLPKLKRYKLPKRIKENKIGYATASYAYQQAEPLYIPFYKRLQRLFDQQRIDFENSKALKKLLKKEKLLSKTYIKKYIEKYAPVNLKETYKALKHYYLKQYNLTRKNLQELTIVDLTKKQKLYIKRVAEGINEHTIDRLTNTIYKSLVDKHRPSKVKVEVEQLFRDMEFYRSERISRTELTKADNESKLNIAKDSGYSKKKWLLSERCAVRHCKECRSNINAGWIGIDTEFPSGHQIPGAHPNCDCTVINRR